MKLQVTILFLLGSLSMNLNALMNVLTLENTLTTNTPQTSAWLLGNQAPNKMGEDIVVSADRMNCLYVGVENPVTLAASGLAQSQLELISDNPTIKIRPASSMGWGGSYMVLPQYTGRVNLSVRDKTTGKVYDFEFRVLPLDKPVIKIGRYSGSTTMTSGELRAQLGLSSKIYLGDIDLQCKISSYKMSYQAKREDPIIVKGTTNRFDPTIKSYIKKAKPGDRYAFTDIYTRCGCDTIGRLANDIIIQIR